MNTAPPVDRATRAQQTLLYGPDGLRIGWSIAAVLLIIILTVYRHMPVPGTHSHSPGTVHLYGPERLLEGETIQFLNLALVTWVLSLIERRPFGVYGLGGRRKLRSFAMGLGWGLLALSALAGTLWSTHLLAFDGLALHGRAALSYAAKWGVVFLVVGLREEFLTRGYIQYTVARAVSALIRAFKPTYDPARAEAIGFWVAATLFSAILFMGLHLENRGETFIGILTVGVAGLTFAYSLWRTGSLWWAIGFHAAWDWAQSFLYGVADSGGMVAGHLLASHPVGRAWLSGGATGPEGSVFVLPTLLLVCVVIRLTLAKAAALNPPTSDDVPRGTSPASALH